MTNNFNETILTTPFCVPGVWLFTYQATIYFAAAPTSFVSFNTYLFGPTGTSMAPITQYAKQTTGTQTLSGINTVVTQSSSVTLIITTSSQVKLSALVNANAQAQAGGTDTSNVQSTYITSTRIG